MTSGTMKAGDDLDEWWVARAEMTEWPAASPVL
jgi:hypothetical protein